MCCHGLHAAGRRRSRHRYSGCRLRVASLSWCGRPLSRPVAIAVRQRARVANERSRVVVRPGVGFRVAGHRAEVEALDDLRVDGRGKVCELSYVQAYLVPVVPQNVIGRELVAASFAKRRKLESSRASMTARWARVALEFHGCVEIKLTPGSLRRRGSEWHEPSWQRPSHSLC